MMLVKVGPSRYVNVERMTHVAPGKKGKVWIHFDVGGGDIGGPDCRTRLEGDEAEAFLRWLDANCERAADV